MNDDDENEKNEGLKQYTKDMLSKLTAREAKVLRMKFGIDLKNDQTLEEVSKQFDVTRKRIKEIEEKALKKLNHRTAKIEIEVKCSFCGKTSRNVEKMIASEITKATICKECILECLKLIQE